MKKLAIFIVLAALPAAAQWRKFGDYDARPTGYFGVGVSAPVNPLASRLNTGWNLAGGIGVRYRYVGVLLDAMFNDFGINRAALEQEGARRGHQRYWAVTVDPVFHVNPRGPIDFYLIGGAGIYGQITEYRASSRDDRFGDRYDLISSNQIVRPGANLGAGFAFNLGRERDPKLFVEARYHHVFTGGSGASLVPVTVGVRF
jgi:hypothetical protein